jgi:hypothetical protein
VSRSRLHTIIEQIEMPTPTSYGSTGILSTLPRELRDKIYGMVIPSCHLVFSNMKLPPLTDDGVSKLSTLRVSKSDYNEAMEIYSRSILRYLNMLSILRVSKSDYNEAMETLYSRSICRYVFDSTRDLSSNSTPPTLIATTKIMNVELEVRAYTGWPYPGRRVDLESPHEETENLCERTILQFSGTETVRKSMHIILLNRSKQFLQKVQGTILQALKALQGFEKVVVEVAYPVQFRPGPIYVFDSGRMVFPERMVYPERMERTLHDMADGARETMARWLEPALGPATTGYLYLKSNDPYATYVQFHPRLYWSTRLSVVKYSAPKQGHTA